jgi:hypothetical protein
MHKNNSRNSSKFKGCSPLQVSCNLTGKCYAVGYYSYAKRCTPFKKSELARMNIDRKLKTLRKQIDE